MRPLFCISTVLLALGLHAKSRFDCSLKAPADREQTRLVWQYTPFLSDAEVSRLDNKLTRFATETSNQVLVVITDTLCGLPASDLAFQLGESWGIGQKGFDNGVVILIEPTAPEGRREVFIAVGYGLEGVIPDLTAKRIVDNELLPRFMEGDRIGGLERATNVIMGLAKGEFDHQQYGNDPFPWGVLVMMLLFFLVIILSQRRRVKRYASTNKVDFWTAWWLLSQMDRKHSGRFGGSSGRMGGGGGFGGFGGGGFGGGGAGGRW